MALFWDAPLGISDLERMHGHAYEVLEFHYLQGSSWKVRL